MNITQEKAIALLQAGQVVALPTETVYGLAACLTFLSGIQEIFFLKGRPLKNPLIIHLASINQIFSFTETLPPFFKELADFFWPGPLTLVIPVISSAVPSIIRADLPSAGFRIPGFELTRKIIEKTGPLVMPSANLSGKPSGTSPLHIEEDFGDHFPVVNGGQCEKGVESTILLFQEGKWIIGRLGAISPEEIEKIVGYPPEILQKNREETLPLCPGHSFRHYAPNAKLLFEGNPESTSTSYILGFKEASYPINKQVYVLGSLKDPQSVAENLYSILRQIDRDKVIEIWVDNRFPEEGLWKTIRERLERAAES